MNLSTIVTILTAGLVLAATHAGAAEPRKGHSDYLASLTARSLKAGFPADSVRLLDVAPGPGREATAKALLERLSQASGGRRLKLTGLKPAAKDRRLQTYLGERGYFEVAGDGSKLRARAAIDDPKEIERAGTTRLEKNELEQLGRRFIGDTLAPFVKVGKDETLTFLGVRYLYNGEASAAEAKSQERERVIANIAIFGREVAGVPVVGSGSKVAMWFDNARQPVGFDVDWPVYRISTRVQKALPQPELARRVAATTVPLEGAKGATVRRFECGYVDLGATRRAKQLQAGCSIAFEGRGEGGEAWARTEYVPAGAQVLKEARWPLASALATGDTGNTADAKFQRYLNGPKAPASAPPAKE